MAVFTLDLIKYTSRWYSTPNHHRLWKLYTRVQATWILCLSTLPPDFWTLISKWNAKFSLIWIEEFGRYGSGGKTCRLAVRALPVWSHPGCVEVSLSKTPNPQLLLTSWLVPCMAAPRRWCVNGWMRGINCTAIYHLPVSNGPVLFLLSSGKMLLTSVHIGLSPILVKLTLENCPQSSHDCGCMYWTRQRDTWYLYGINSHLLKL